jgi:CDGSH-type Zn-finger protein
MSENAHPAVKITPLKDGPVKIEGGQLDLCGPDGATLETKTVMFLCRCGASQNKPYCDGSHRGIAFNAD